MSLHKEISFETEICQHLAAHGWLYTEGDAAGYPSHTKFPEIFPAKKFHFSQILSHSSAQTLYHRVFKRRVWLGTETHGQDKESMKRVSTPSSAARR